MRRLAVVGVVVTALVAGACGGKDKPLGPTATLRQATTTTDPYAVPSVIDEAYVNRVLAGLDKAVGDVIRIVVSTKTIPPEALTRLKAVNADDALQLTVDLFQDDILNNFSGYQKRPGDKSTTVTRLITVKPSCVFAEVHKDFSAVGVDPDPAFSRQWVVLVPWDPARDPMGYNPTRWMFMYDGFQEDLSQPDDLCVDS